MPHTNRGRSNVPPPYRPAEFININLAADDKARIKAQEFTLEQCDVCLENLLREGYKVTVKFDEKNDCYACWFVAPDSSANKGCILAGRGSTAIKAIKQAFYIHLVLLERTWTDGSLRQGGVIDD